MTLNQVNKWSTTISSYVECPYSWQENCTYNIGYLFAKNPSWQPLEFFKSNILEFFRDENTDFCLKQVTYSWMPSNLWGFAQRAGATHTDTYL